MSLRYADILDELQRSKTSRRKGEKTRDRLKLAAVHLLDEQGYRDMRVADICERAGVAAATFYLYYENKTEITTEVLTEFISTVIGLADDHEPYRTPFAAIYKANLGWIGTVRANAGLLRCLLQLSDEIPEFAELNQRTNHEWYRRVARNIARSGSEFEPTALLVAYSLGSMIDELCRRLFVVHGNDLEALAQRIAPTDEALAEFIAVLWYRAVYGCDPQEVESRPARDLLDLGAALRKDVAAVGDDRLRRQAGSPAA